MLVLHRVADHEITELIGRMFDRHLEWEVMCLSLLDFDRLWQVDWGVGATDDRWSVGIICMPSGVQFALGRAMHHLAV